MVLKKKWLSILTVMMTVLLLGACSDTNDSGQTDDGSNYDNPRNHTAEDFTTFSEGLEKNPVWIVTDTAPGRTSTVSYVYVFENGMVKSYRDFPGLQIEDINKFTDDELIQYVTDKSKQTKEGKYTLDITLDELGQYTEKIEVKIEDGTDVWVADLETLWHESNYETKDEYIKSIEGDERYEIKGESVVITKKLEEKDALITVYPESVHQTISDTTYSGLRLDDYYSLFTRVDDSFVGFVVDGPDTKKKNITIEGQ